MLKLIFSEKFNNKLIMSTIFKISSLVFLFIFLAHSSVQAKNQQLSTETSYYPFSTDSNFLTRWNGEKYQAFVVKGINLGVAVPGTFPGEMAATREQYTQWLQDIKAVGYNAIRVYTLHYPRFYEVLDSFNVANPNNPLYLIQGVWLEEELPGYNHDLFFNSTSFMQEIKEAVDCMHGNAVISPRLGKAYGTYTVDASKWVMAYIIGREVSPLEINTTNTNYPGKNAYYGSYLSIENVQAAEVFVTCYMDSLLSYEQLNYQTQRPISFSSWPTLDPLTHPTETMTQEDEEQLDLSKIDFTKANAGFFASYHAYPYYPDFISREPKYKYMHDDEGPNSYLAYLQELKSHYKNIPLLIAEYGVPSSWGVAHYSQSGMNHGGLSELEQGKVSVRLLKTIIDANCAGGAQFALIDEWFKRTWICDPFDFPVDDRVMWHNVSAAEQNFGIIGFRRGDFSYLPWQTFAPTDPIKAISAGLNYAYFNLQVELRQPFTDLDTLWVALDTYSAALGEVKLPNGQLLPTGAEFLLRITNDAADLFVTEAYDLYGIWHNISLVEQQYQSVPSDGKPWKLVRWKNNQAEPDIQYIGHMQVNRLNLPQTSLDAVRFINDTMHVRLPWSLLQVINPGRKRVMHDDRSTHSIREDTITDGIAVSLFYKEQLMATASRFSWDNWNNFNNVVEYKKDSYTFLQEALKLYPGIFVAQTDAYVVYMNKVLHINASEGVLINDLLVENDPAKAYLVTPPDNGFLSLRDDGSFIYVPYLDYSGEDSFTYRSANAYQSSAPVTVKLTVLSDNSTVGLVRLAPNPADDFVQILSTGNMTEIIVVDIAGNRVQHLFPNANELQLDVSSYKQGSYVLYIQIGDEFVAQKLLVN